MASNASAVSNLSGLLAPTSGVGMSQGQSNTLAPLGVGSNQYSMYPNTPGTVTSPTTLPGSAPTGTNTGAYYSLGGDSPGTNSVHLTPTEDPTLTNQYYNMLSGQVGAGLPGFDLSTLLPSSGQATTPGALNAPLNSTDTALQSFLAGGSTSTPGANQLATMAQTGDPVNQTPAWQAMIASQQQNTAQNANNLREQFAGTGSLSSSPFAAAMQQFYNQNTENQNAQLTAATTAEGDTAAARQLSAGQGIQSQASTLGSNLQTIDQQAIQNLLTEFNYTLPQNNPLLANEAQAANMQPSDAQTPTTAQNFASVIGSLSGLV